MLTSRSDFLRTLRRWSFATCIAVLGAAAVAAPDGVPPAEPAASANASAPDVVARFLAEKGLIAAPVAVATASESSIVGRLRDRASDMVLTAMNFLGVPYKRGGTTAEHGFDCSGFTRHVFELSLGLVLPRRADEQAKSSGLISIKRDELKPGDLVFFNTLKQTFSHVGIYVGEGKFIHSPRTGAEVRVEDMGTHYWSKRFTGARRAELSVGGVGNASSAMATTPAPATSQRTVY